ASPAALSGTVTGSGPSFIVTLNWTAPATGAAPTFYVIEAGSIPGASNLASIQTTGSGTSFSTTAIGSGSFFVRVRAGNSAGLGGASNEIVVTLGSTPTIAPGPPGNLRVQVSGSAVTLTWDAPTSGAAPTTYVGRAGSSPGGSNLANFSTGNTLTSLLATGVP